MSAQKLRRIMSCSLSSDELLPLIRDSASALSYQHAEARAREGYLAVSTRKGCIRSTAYWIRNSLCYFVLRVSVVGSHAYSRKALVSSPDPSHYAEEGLVTFERFLGPTKWRRGGM